MHHQLSGEGVQLQVKGVAPRQRPQHLRPPPLRQLRQRRVDPAAAAVARAQRIMHRRVAVAEAAAEERGRDGQPVHLEHHERGREPRLGFRELPRARRGPPLSLPASSTSHICGSYSINSVPSICGRISSPIDCNHKKCGFMTNLGSATSFH